jgi:hypothetical protein
MRLRVGDSDARCDRKHGQRHAQCLLHVISPLVLGLSSISGDEHGGAKLNARVAARSSGVQDG